LMMVLRPSPPRWRRRALFRGGAGFPVACGGAAAPGAGISVGVAAAWGGLGGSLGRPSFAAALRELLHGLKTRVSGTRDFRRPPLVFAVKAGVPCSM